MASAAAPPVHRPAWNLAWLTPSRCRLIFALLIPLVFVAQWIFLTHFCPLDLSGDEAQYWDWSRRLDLSYYSKGPLVAYIIRASCSLLGDNMPAVRLPALILGLGSASCTYWLTKKLFASHRLALGAFVLQLFVPIYIAGLTLMTIDAPFFFCWALATCLAVKAAIDGCRWAFIACGAVVGLGILAKYAMLLWPPFFLLFLLLDRNSSHWLKTIWPWLMIVVALAFTTPIIIWNSQHGWATFGHVFAQIGTAPAHESSSHSFLDLIGSQIGIVNPALVAPMIAAVVYALGRGSRDDPFRRQLRFLVFIGLPFLVVCFLDSFLAKVQANWPAPAYFSLLILTAYFFGLCLNDPARWRRWRGGLYATILLGLLIQPILHGSTLLYPPAKWVNQTFPLKSGRLRVPPAQFDLAARLRGISDPFAKTVSREWRALPPGSFILAAEYQEASELAFYVDGQPPTYYIGSYWTDPAQRRRLTQFDLWPDRALDRPELIGQSAIYVGPNNAPLADSFEQIQRLPDIVVEVDGMPVHTYAVWHCVGFKGIARPKGEAPR